MVTSNDLLLQEAKLSLIGLGYVGLPIAVAFSKKIDVIGFDINAEKVDTYKRGLDPTREVGDEVVKNCSVEFTSDADALREALFHIVAVPTPVRDDHAPDLSPLISASRLLASRLRPGAIVVYESTVYPGVTEDVCAPILEEGSGLVCGKDFKIGYSPERINPGDKEHRLENIIKVVSGMDDEALQTISEVYELVVEAGVYKASSIRVAEAAKVIENSQRDINIAFMNELSIIFDRMGIDTLDVLQAAGTKWNFLNFRPGLVGGHCIGVDPYYLTYAAERAGYHSQIILAGRHINDDMGKYVAQKAIKMLSQEGVCIRDAKVGILGFTFKENCPDTRNTKVIDIVDELREYGVDPLVCDPVADADEMFVHYDVRLAAMDELKELDALIVAVRHDCFRGLEIAPMLAPSGVLLDVKGAVQPVKGHPYWRL